MEVEIIGRVRILELDTLVFSFAFVFPVRLERCCSFIHSVVHRVQSVHALSNPTLDSRLKCALGVKRHGSQLFPLVLTYRRQGGDHK